MRATETNPKRQEVWMVNFDPSIGEEQKKLRPAVVMNPNEIGRLKLRIVVPITEWDEKYGAFPWFVRLPWSRDNGLTKDSGADAFQIKSVSLERFSHQLGSIKSTQASAIADAVALCVGFELPVGN